MLLNIGKLKPNEKHNMLTAMYDFFKDGIHYVHCKCDCGNEKDMKFFLFRTGKIKSCGCLLHRDKTGEGRKYLSGQTFDRLTVMSDYWEDVNGVNIHMCHCKCSCGNEVDIRYNSLVSGGSKSCGCLKHEYNVSKKGFADNSGRRFGRLVVQKDIRRTDMPINRHHWCECLCDCGNTCLVEYRKLVSGDTKSCGCLYEEAVKYGSITHGMSKTRFWRIYTNIGLRCNNPKDLNYLNYGGRGIKCLWNSFEEFKEDMYGSYLEHVEEYGENNTSIDRIDVDGDYCKENCRWATQQEQANNKRNNIYLYYGNHKYTLPDLARLFDIPQARLRSRLYSHPNIDIFTLLFSPRSDMYGNIR